MAHFKATFVSALLLCFSCSFPTECVQEYEEDYSAAEKYSNWQSARTTGTRSDVSDGITLTRSKLINSSPDAVIRNRSRNSRYETANNPDTRLRYETRRSDDFSDDVDSNPVRPFRQRRKNQQQIFDAGRGAIERRNDEIPEANYNFQNSARSSRRGETRGNEGATVKVVLRRRRPSGLENNGRNAEKRTGYRVQDEQGQIISSSLRLGVPPQETNFSNSLPERKFLAANSFSERRRGEEDVQAFDATTRKTQKHISRGRTRARIAEMPRKSDRNDEISESDNYPIEFLERIKNSDQGMSESDRMPVRSSRLQQREAKSYPVVGGDSDVTRFHQKYGRLRFSTEKSSNSEKNANASESNAEQHKDRDLSRGRKNSVKESRPRSRNQFASDKNATKNNYGPKINGDYSRRYTSTRTYTSNRQPKLPGRKTESQRELGEQFEALKSAESKFYRHPADVGRNSKCSRGCKKAAVEESTYEEWKNMKIVDVELHSDGSEEERQIQAANVTEGKWESKKSENLATTLQAADSSEESSTEMTTVSAIPSMGPSTDNEPFTTDTANPKLNQPTEAVLPSTRHRFSSKLNNNIPSSTENINSNSDFSTSNSTIPADLTSLFDETPDSTLSITTLFNNSFADSISVAPELNQIKPLDELNTTNTTEITNTNIVTFSTRPSTPTVSATKSPSPKKQSKSKKSRKLNKAAATGSRSNPLDNSSILRNIVSLFAPNTSATTKKSVAGKKKDTKTTAATTTTTVSTTTEAPITRVTVTSTTATTPTAAPELPVLENIQNYINETLEVIQNKTGVPPQIHDVPRVALDALTPETVPKDGNTTETPVMDITVMTTSESIPNTTDISDNNEMRKITSQYVYFDYTSATPIPRQFSRFRDKSRSTTTTTTTSTTTLTTPDYFVYGVYPNNTVVRKRAWKTFDYERYKSPYIIFGIYPNNTIVKKFPNGTVINDEYMTSDNEIKNPSDNQRRITAAIPTTITTAQTTTNSDKLSILTVATTMTSKPSETDEFTTTEISSEDSKQIKESSSDETENEIEKFENENTESSSDAEDRSTTTKVSEEESSEEISEKAFTESENDIEEAEEIDEERNALVAEVETTTTEASEDNQIRINTESGVPQTTTTEFEDSFRTPTTEATFKFNILGDDDETTTKGADSTTESVATTTMNSNREGKSFSLNGMRSGVLGQIESTTEEKSLTTTIGSQTEATTTPDQDEKARISILYDTDSATTTEKSMPTTTYAELTETKTTDRTDKTTLADFDLQQILLPTTTKHEDSLSFNPATEAEGTEHSTTPKSKFLADLIDESFFTSTAAERRTGEETTTLSNLFNEVEPRFATTEASESENDKTKSTIVQDESSGLVNLAFRSLSSSDTATDAKHSSTTTRFPKFITSTMKSMYISEKKIKVKMKKKSATTPKSTTGKQNIFIVTPDMTLSDNYANVSKKGKVKFVTLTPGVIVTTDIKDENDVLTMSSQHIQKVTKAPANVPKNLLENVVVEIEGKSPSPIPEILKNVEKELQGNGLSVSLARRIIEMAIERAITTESFQATTQTTAESTAFPSTTSTLAEIVVTESTTESSPTTLKPTTTTTDVPSTTTAATPPTTPTARTESITSKEISTTYNEFLNTVNVNSLSVGFLGEYKETTTNKINEDDINELIQGLWQGETHTTTLATTTTTKPRNSSRNRKAKTSRNFGQKPSGISTLSESDKQLLEAILKQQNSNLSIKELDKIIENQIRLAEEVRKASKNTKKKPRLTTTTTTTTTTTQTTPLFGFLFSLFSDNSSPSSFPVTRVPATRSRSKSNRGPGSTRNTTKSIKNDSLKFTQDGNQTGERSTQGDLVTAAIDVTKAVSKFMGTVISRDRLEEKSPVERVPLQVLRGLAPQFPLFPRKINAFLLETFTNKLLNSGKPNLETCASRSRCTGKLRK